MKNVADNISFISDSRCFKMEDGIYEEIELRDKFVSAGSAARQYNFDCPQENIEIQPE